MALKCAHCGNADQTQAELDRVKCLNCGGYTNADGTAGDGGFRWTSEQPEGVR